MLFIVTLPRRIEHDTVVMIDKDQEDTACMHRKFFKKRLFGTCCLHYPQLVNLILRLHCLITMAVFLHRRNSIDVFVTRTKPTLLGASATATDRTLNYIRQFIVYMYGSVRTLTLTLTLTLSK